jgi:type VII secretion integral membrane protein EccD
MPVTVSVPAGLVALTVQAPQRRVDLALPAGTPLAELLPDLLRCAGAGLADAGQAHGGWVLRRADGSPLSVGADLSTQGVPDGAVLYLVPARTGWPELDYDDVVDAIADGTRGYGRSWEGTATRLVAWLVAGTALLLGALAVTQAGSLAGPAGLALAGLLVLAGTVASRAYGDAVTGALLAGLALPFALVGGGELAGSGRLGAPALLAGSVAVLLAGSVGAVGVGYRMRIFAGAATAGLLGGLGALLGYRLPAAGAAAIVLALLVTGAAAVPLLAIRLGGLPVPGPGVPPTPEAGRAPAALARTDELLSGMLCGLAVATAGASLPLVTSGGPAGRLLVAVAATGFLVRARLHPAVRQRLPLLVAGLAGALALLATIRPGLPLAAALVGSAVPILLAGARYGHRPPGPYLGRAADLLDALCVVSAIPVACAVLGLYGRIRGLAG